MLTALHDRQPGAPAARILWWHFLHSLCYAWVGPCYRYRCWGVDNIPRRGPILFVANHQSFLDPILVGLGAHHRQFFAVARSTLFNHPAFAWLIRSINAIPVERGSSDLAAMRTAITVLEKQQALLIFPEGTRTRDGTTARFAPGTMLLIKRAKPFVVPVAIEGSYDAWPKSRPAPYFRGRIGVLYGAPIDPNQLTVLGPDNALTSLRNQVETMRLELVKRLARVEKF